MHSLKSILKRARARTGWVLPAPCTSLDTGKLEKFSSFLRRNFAITGSVRVSKGGLGRRCRIKTTSS